MKRKTSVPRIVITYRAVLERELRQLLARDADALSIEQVESLIFRLDSSDFPRYVQTMLAALHCDVDDVSAATLQVIRDSWNYFPHRSLDGRCPAELLLRGPAMLE